MKKFLSGLIIGAIVSGIIGVFAANYMAETANFKIMVEGEIFETDKPVLAVDGSTYLPLKAIGEALGVPVVWNGAERRVEVGDCSSAAVNDAKAVAEKYLNAAMCLNGQEAAKYIAPETELYNSVAGIGNGIEEIISVMFDAAEEEIGMDGLLDETKVVTVEFINGILDKAEYSISESQVSGDTATVKYSYKMPDISDIDIDAALTGKITDEFMADIATKTANMTEEETIKYFGMRYAALVEESFSKMSTEDIPMIEKSGVVTLKKINGKWLVTADK